MRIRKSKNRNRPTAFGEKLPTREKIKAILDRIDLAPERRLDAAQINAFRRIKAIFNCEQAGALGWAEINMLNRILERIE